MDETTAFRLVQDATNGDEAALTNLIEKTQHQVYGIAIRMLGVPQDSEDATQEILLRVITNLARFRGESAYSTWVYRIAVNHLINVRNRSIAEKNHNFESFGASIDGGIAQFSQQDDPLDDLVSNEVRLSCTHGMLLCLSRDERIAFLLGAILEYKADEASSILEVTPSTFRKRLSRARAKLQKFLSVRCGLYDSSLPCRCAKQAPIAVQNGYLDPKQPIFAQLHLLNGMVAGAEIKEFSDLFDEVKVLETLPHYAAPGELAERIKKILNAR